MRIIHLPTDLGMRAYSLSRAERELGHNSQMIIMSSGVHVSGFARPIKSSNVFYTGARLLWEFIKSLQADVIMANTGRSLIDSAGHHVHLVDVPLYDLFGKRLIVTYQGCDIRICETCPVRDYLPVNLVCPNAVDRSYTKADNIKMKRFKIWSRHADFVFGITPDLCLVNGVSYSPHAKYIDPALLSITRSTNNASSRFRIGHMARRHVQGNRISGVEYLKGTPWIEEVIVSIKREYPGKVEYVPIENLSWMDCLMAISSCDVLIDQVISGWYGGISVEAALVGTLPIAYIDQKLLRYLPVEMRSKLPVLSLSHKDQLFDTLVDLIKHIDKTRKKAQDCRENAMQFHDAKKIAGHFLENYYR